MGAHHEGADRTVVGKAESFVESLLFKYKTVDVEGDKDGGAEHKSLLPVLDRNSLSESNLNLFNDRKLIFDDENSLALKSLKDG